MSDTTYSDSAIAMTRASRVAACDLAAAAFKSAGDEARNLANCEIAAFNHLRAAGEYLNEASGRGQLLFTAAGREFCRNEILPLLPAGFKLEQVQACVHIANNVKAPIKNRDELKAVKQELQLAFQCLGLIDPPRRKEIQSATGRNIFSDVVSRLAGLKNFFKELDEAAPMETWSANDLDDFLETAQPLKEKISRAEKIRLGLK